MAGIFGFFKSKEKSSSEVAKERLQILVAHERRQSKSPEWMPEMQRRILDVIKDYVDIPDEALNFDLRNDDDEVSVLEINIDCPLEKS